ncbi:glycoside hydrolase family 79 protein [Sparassis latifolia]|uniref:Beta-glucuronidase C-terminal domain-containing protein n=1 Tax=Sparassis crispa TaxID=139825 RepID=A0A401GYG2_9APHY|nr:hypothetical protein SCP_1001060 [Sparassis crispa]GBE86864.1 hypothetical protein SCP_1001060 [Sparassis crispa]
MLLQGLCLLLSCQIASAVTVYDVQGVFTPGSATTTPDTASGTSVYDPPTYTGVQAAAWNPIILAPPPVPSPPITSQFALLLLNSAQEVANLSIQQNGAFLGFSIEMSVIDQVIGLNGSFLQTPFLNLMALISERAGGVRIRVGGNTQDFAVEVSTLPDYKDIEKDKEDTNNPMLNNVSSLVGAKWWLGIPFNDTSDLRLQIVELGEAILGDNIIGFQLGNEPDQYAGHGHRPGNYSPTDYFNDFELVSEVITNDSKIPVHNNLVAPSVSGQWTPEQVWDTGFIPAFSDVLGALAVEHYPFDNCGAVYPDGGFGPPIDPQAIFPAYLTHASGQSIVEPFLNSTYIAQQAGKPFLMFETNTASCGGFPGVSDSFGAALWGIDYGLQMVYANFSGANMHVGGVDDSYNPFTPQPTNMSSTGQWTIGPIFYSVIVAAEALGPSGTAQVVDLNANSYNPYTPAYAIYEHGSLARIALFSYITDPSGASMITVNISVGGGSINEPSSTPAQVSAKYLLAESVSAKENFTWAGQTFGPLFRSDSRLQGNQDVKTVQCDQSAGVCQVSVPAPGFALVFLSSTVLEESTPSSTATFATTTYLDWVDVVTATIPQSVLATMNGDNGVDREVLKSTSEGSSGVQRTTRVGSAVVAVAAMFTGFLFLHGAFH